MTRTSNISVDLSPDTYDAIARAGADIGLSTTDYARRTLTIAAEEGQEIEKVTARLTDGTNGVAS